MSHSLYEITIERIEITHRLLCQVTEDLSEAQFVWSPGDQAPPIGWHLWHIARWADRLQASLPTTDGKAGIQIWEAEELARKWGLEPVKTRVLQVGLDMEHAAATEMVVQVGKARILDYARRSFAACNAAIKRLQAEDFEEMRQSIKAFHIDDNWQVTEAPPAETTIASDLAFQLAHASRHLGMIEGIRGTLGLLGSASA